MSDLNRLREMVGLELKEEGGNFADLDQLQEYIYDKFNQHECCVGQDGNYLWCQLPFRDGDADFDRERGGVDGQITVEIDETNKRVLVTGDIVYNTENDMEIYEDDYLVLAYELSHDPEEIDREVKEFCNKMLDSLRDYDDEIRQAPPKQVEDIDRMRELAGIQEEYPAVDTGFKDSLPVGAKVRMKRDYVKDAQLKAKEGQIGIVVHSYTSGWSLVNFDGVKVQLLSSYLEVIDKLEEKSERCTDCGKERMVGPNGLCHQCEQKDKEKENITDSEKLREWANSLSKNYEDRGKVFKQPEGETIDNSLRRYLNAKAMPVRIEEEIDDKKLLKEWKKFKSSK